MTKKEFRFEKGACKTRARVCEDGRWERERKRVFEIIERQARCGKELKNDGPPVDARLCWKFKIREKGKRNLKEGGKKLIIKGKRQRFAC